jgi:hypothetical protein
MGKREVYVGNAWGLATLPPISCFERIEVKPKIVGMMLYSLRIPFLLL